MTTIDAKSRGQEVWLTDTGDNTCDDTEQRAWIDYVINTFDYDNMTVHWTKVFIYYLWDPDTDCAANLVRRNGTDRPAYIDYRNRATGQTWYTAAVNLQASDGEYLTAESGGAGDVNANRSSCGAWETFDLLDLNGGELRDGDRLAFQAVDGLYLQADLGGAGRMLAVGRAPLEWETFVVIDFDHPRGVVQAGMPLRCRVLPVSTCRRS
jgi:hypothetical protein